MTQFAKPKIGKYKGKSLPIVGYKSFVGTSVKTMHLKQEKDDRCIILKAKRSISYFIRAVELVKEEPKSSIPKVDRKEDTFLTFDRGGWEAETNKTYNEALKKAEEYIKQYDDDEDKDEVYIYKLIKVISKKVKKTVEIIESDPIE